MIQTSENPCPIGNLNNINRSISIPGHFWKAVEQKTDLNRGEKERHTGCKW